MWPEATLLPTVKYEKDNLYYDTYDDIILIVHAAVRRRRLLLPDFHIMLHLGSRYGGRRSTTAG